MLRKNGEALERVEKEVVESLSLELYKEKVDVILRDMANIGGR